MRPREMEGNMYSLVKDFGVDKRLVKRHLEVWIDPSNDPEGHERAYALVKRRGDRYTLPEIEELLSCVGTAHNDCVLANADDYSPVEVYVAARVDRLHERAWERLRRLKAGETYAIITLDGHAFKRWGRLLESGKSYIMANKNDVIASRSARYGCGCEVKLSLVNADSGPYLDIVLLGPAGSELEHRTAFTLAGPLSFLAHGVEHAVEIERAI
jgi:hypothetical protein